MVVFFSPCSFQASFCVGASHTIILVRLDNHRYIEGAGSPIRQCEAPQLGNPIRSFRTHFGTSPRLLPQELSIPGRADTVEPVPLQDIVDGDVSILFVCLFCVGQAKRPFVLFLYLKRRHETEETGTEISAKGEAKMETFRDTDILSKCLASH